MTGRLGHIVNRAATGGDRRVEAAPGVILRAPESFSALDECLAELCEAGVAAILIDGGDGTVREVISRAPEIWGGAPPPFAIAPNGNTNLIARHAGRVAPEAAGRLAAAPEAAKRKCLPMMKVERAGARLLRGFILGAGAYETATRFAQRELQTRHGRQLIQTVYRLLRSEALRTPTRIGFETEGGEGPARDRLLVALTTLEGALIYGLDPFGRATKAGPLRALDIDAAPPRLALAAVCLAVGRPRRWMRDHYRQVACARATMRLDADFVMDGERFSPGSDGRLRLSAAETATFLSF